MERYEAEQLLEHYKAALFRKFKDWGDHPSETEKIDLAVARLEVLIIQKLTESCLPSEPLSEPIYPHGLHKE